MRVWGYQQPAPEREGEGEGEKEQGVGRERLTLLRKNTFQCCSKFKD